MLLEHVEKLLLLPNIAEVFKDLFLRKELEINWLIWQLYQITMSICFFNFHDLFRKTFQRNTENLLHWKIYFF